VPGETFLTRQGYEKLISDLKALKDRRQVLFIEIDEARQKGDLKENAEYHSAKEAQQKVMMRIGEIEGKLRAAQIIEEMNVKADEVRIGSTVKIYDAAEKETYTYTLVDGAEADFAKGRISVRSPVAEGLLGHKVGDTVTIKLPAGEVTYKIEKVTRDI
jgi:transcription elongation factor GreA